MRPGAHCASGPSRVRLSHAALGGGGRGGPTCTAASPRWLVGGPQGARPGRAFRSSVTCSDSTSAAEGPAGDSRRLREGRRLYHARLGDHTQPASPLGRPGVPGFGRRERLGPSTCKHAPVCTHPSPWEPCCSLGLARLPHRSLWTARRRLLAPSYGANPQARRGHMAQTLPPATQS